MGAPAIVTKTIKSGIDAGLNCVISDSRTPDSFKDLVGNLKDTASGGWLTSNYLKNPIVLFNNLADFPAATMQGVHWKGGQLIGRLVLTPENTSERHDELRKLISAGVLKGISCSFRPIESVPLKGGTHFLKMELVSVSLVAFGCHPDALLEAKSMGVSTETIRMIFKSQNAPKRYTQEQRVVIQRRAKEKLKKQVNPEDYSAEEDFVRDCTANLMANHNHDRGRAEKACHTRWAERDHGVGKSEVRKLNINKQLLESKIRKAEAALARAKSKPLNKTATIAERMEHEASIERYNNHLRSLRRGLEVFTRTRVTNKAGGHITGSQKARSEVVPQEKDESRYQITWRGQKIPLGWSYTGSRKNWWDPES